MHLLRSPLKKNLGLIQNQPLYAVAEINPASSKDFLAFQTVVLDDI